MNRLTPLIAPRPARSGPARFASIDAFAGLVQPSNEDLRLFLTAFAGGLIFFGTLLGLTDPPLLSQRRGTVRSVVAR